MKKLLIIALIASLFSCSGKEEECTNGTIRFFCTSDNPYICEIDGVIKGTVAGNSFLDFTVPEGSHTVRATQQSGYLFTPTIVTKTAAVFGCQTTQFTFP